MGADAHVQTGHLSFAGTLLLSNVQLKTAGPSGERLDLFSADQVEVRFDWLSLLTGQLRATQITAVRPTLYLIEDRATNRWNYEHLQRAPGPEGGLPETSSPRSVGMSALPFVVLGDARVQWAEINNGVETFTAASVIDGQLTPDPVQPMRYDFQMDEHPQSGQQGISVTGDWDVANSTFSASTAAIDLATLDPASLPRQVRQWWSEHELSGRVAALRVTLDHESGLNVGIDLRDVSMVQVFDRQMTQSPIARKVRFKDVSGALQFNVTHSTLQATNLTGSVFGHTFALDAEFDGFSPDAPFNLSVRFPNADVKSDYPDLVYSFPIAYDVVERIRPSGLMDINLDFQRPLRGGRVFIRGAVVCKDVSARFSHVPYPLDHVHGIIHFVDDYIQVDGLTAMAGESRVAISGTAGITADNQAIDMTVQSDYTVFDERLKDCLPENIQEIWLLFSPVGTGKIYCHVTRPNHPHEIPRVDLTVEPMDVSGSYRDFPYPLRHVHGKIIFSPERTQIVALDGDAGLDGSGRVHFDGVIEYPHGEAPQVQPHINVVADHVPMDAARSPRFRWNIGPGPMTFR